MSHIVTVAAEVRDREALAAACRRLRLKEPENRVSRFFDGSLVKGEAVELPGWSYPAVFDLQGGVRFDNYEGRWGERRHLDGLLQAYAVEKTRIEARRSGHAVREEQLSGGRIRLTLTAPAVAQAVSA